MLYVSLRNSQFLVLFLRNLLRTWYVSVVLMRNERFQNSLIKTAEHTHDTLLAIVIIIVGPRLADTIALLFVLILYYILCSNRSSHHLLPHINNTIHSRLKLAILSQNKQQSSNKSGEAADRHKFKHSFFSLHKTIHILPFAMAYPSASISEQNAMFVTAVTEGVSVLMKRCGYSRERATSALLRELSRGESVRPTDDEVSSVCPCYKSALDFFIERLRLD
jgi:hypothetical protein